MINTFRRHTLGLAPLSRWSDYLTFPDGRPVPVLYGFSSTVVPVPADYPPHAHVTGYWFLPDQATWQPPPELQAFLAAGEPPLYIGFGSMGFGKTRRRPRAPPSSRPSATSAPEPSSPPAGAASTLTSRSSDDVLVVRDVPHDWLFPAPPPSSITAAPAPPPPVCAPAAPP